jgi:Bacterial PH domain
MNAKPPLPTHEHEFEPQHGLPERLPAGERLLWQGAPDWRVLAQRVFHFNKVALYFALLLGWRFADTLSDAGFEVAARSLAWPAPLAAIGLGLLALLAWLNARATVYTLTDQRIVMRIGIVLTVAYNLPLVRIEGADLHPAGGGHHDIALTLERGTRIAWLHLWPHARPWRVAHPQPMLRALPDGQVVSALLARAWSEANGSAAATAGAAVPARALRPVMVAR